MKLARVVKALAWRVRERLRAHPADALVFSEARRWSQNGEDGLLAEIFRRLGEGDRRFVEIGAADGAECNTRLLLESGWTGAWVEADPRLADVARVAVAGRGVTVVTARLTAEDALATLRQAGVSRNVDLLSIDVDGNDYYLWSALAELEPRVVVIEYNASREPGVDWVMPYDPGHVWDLSDRFGASLTALERLARELGYTLVACDSRGVNAFFVRAGDAAAFHRPGDVAFHYQSPKYCGLAFGHQPR